MARSVGFAGTNAAFLCVLLGFAFQDAPGALVVSPAGPARLSAAAGANVTLAVSFGGAADPTVVWYMGDLPVATWTINSPRPPDIADGRRGVLRVEPDGSLAFVRVTVGYSGGYTVKMTKSGVGNSSASFTLTVFEVIQGVTLAVTPDSPAEGADRFTLRYSLTRGTVERQRWLFDGSEIGADGRHAAQGRSLAVLGPRRNDTGRYTVLLDNPYGSSTAGANVTVLYGPDEPALEARPPGPFYVPGDSVSLSCRAEGLPPPTAEWLFGGRSLPGSGAGGGVLHLADVQTADGGTYTCSLLNEKTRRRREKNVTVNVYERPPGGPACSVQSESNDDDAALQYRCSWPGGTPEARLHFPALSNGSRGDGDLSLTVAAAADLDGKAVTCAADHPLGGNTCNATASRPARFLPAVTTAVDATGKIVVAVRCASRASPEAAVSWYEGGEAIVADGTTHRISGDTTRLEIRGYNVSAFLRRNYTCVCRNPLGVQRREVQLRGPTISDSGLFPNEDGTVVTLTWEVPPTSIVTGFDVQMKGPDLAGRGGDGARAASDGFRTIRQKPGSARSADIFPLDPGLTYRFRVVPKARMTDGEPSEGHRIGPGDGLSGPAVAGIAAGIPCSLLLLLLLGGLVFLSVRCSRDGSRQTRYPMSRAAEKTMTTQTDVTPHNLLAAGLKSPADYNRLQQTPSERSVALPSFVPPPPVRVATTV